MSLPLKALSLSSSAGGGSASTSLSGSKELYVDGNRTDAYTPTGNINAPFKTVQAAINQIITNADNSTYGYYINVAPGIYLEDLSLNDTHLVNLQINGNNSRIGTSSFVTPAFDTSSNNSNLSSCVVTNMSFVGDINVVGANGSSLGSNIIQFIGCSFITLTNGVNVNCCCNFGMYGVSHFASSGKGITFQNCITAFIAQESVIQGGTTPTAIITNSGANKPAGFAATLGVLQNSLSVANMTVDAGSTVAMRLGSRLGTVGGTLDISGIFQVYNSFVRSNITVNLGGSLSFRDGQYGGTLTNNGTTTNDGNNTYVPTTSANWSTVPVTYQQAVDTLATGIFGSNVSLSTLGKSFRLKEGANATMGTAVMNGTTAVTVSTTAVTASSRIMVTVNTSGGTVGTPYVDTRSAATSFNLKSTNALDTSTVAWVIFEPA